MARPTLGLDLGSHSIKVAELHQTLRSVEVGEMRSLRRDPDAPLGEVLRGLVQTHDLGADAVVASLPGDRVATRPLSFPFRDRRRIAPAVPFELDDQVPFELGDYLWDWQVVRETRGRADVATALVPRSAVRELLATLGEAGLDPRILEPEGLVLGNLAEIFELPDVRLLIDVGHRKSTLCLCEGGQPVLARSVPFAGGAITRALAGERGESLEDAEARKHEDGIFGGGRPESPAAVAVVERLASEVLRLVGAAEGLEGEPRVELLGGGAHLHRLDEYLAERTGLAVGRLGLPASELGTAVAGAGDPLLFAPALALAARGTLRPHTRMNLRKDEFATRLDLRKIGREFRPTAALAALALVLAIGTVATDAVLTGRRADAVEARALEVYRQAFPDRPAPPSALAGMQQAVRDTQRRADTLGVYRGNLSALDVLQEVSAHVPGDLEVVFEELVIDGQLVQVKGHSNDFKAVDRLRAALARYEPFSEITVGDITSDTRRGGRNFSVRISLGDVGQGVGPVNELWARVRAWVEGLAPRERMALAAMGACLAIALVFFGAIQPALSAASRAHERLTAAERELEALEQLRLRYDEVHARLASFEERIRQGPRGEIFTTLEELARQSAVKVDSMEPRVSPASEDYRETKVQVALRGVTLAQAVSYLHRIESAPQLLSIKSLRVRTRQEAPELLDVTFTVSSFEPRT